MTNRITQVFLSASRAIESFSQTEACAKAARLIATSTRPLLTSGIGKSGHIAAKSASTFRSLGKEAHFIHPAEASHGDLGAFGQGAILLAFSNSGETSELSDIINFCKMRDNPIIAITANEESSLGQAAEIVIAYGEIEEADRNKLAPTTSTTLSLVIADAIALEFAEQINFQSTDFAHFHPRGRLGAQLKTARDLMHFGKNAPTLPHDCDMKTLLLTMSEKKLGVAVLLNQGKVVGLITDGDLRRNIDQLWNIAPIEIATRNPLTIEQNVPIGEAIEIMTKQSITQLIVQDAGAFMGILHLHDCMRA